ncbi:hypothetical protein [Pseudorhodoferax sp. Leaf267]|uniref:hypothetical protein n=1 Tax=Pseudorhodoferax sp. Leaf267 TaxID=1736316 RepID=UPI0006F38550|nr:hypothetical protein [Pseudorhodoferax sp. Leaf267]KQP14226.1 hypothetical protein ASF43_15495 [Pseudorhodoferax sp. Leaf267]
MTHPTMKLVIEEPHPGAYVWALMETDDRGKTVRVAQRAEEASDSYEAALATGTRRLHAALHAQTPSTA